MSFKVCIKKLPAFEEIRWLKTRMKTPVARAYLEENILTEERYATKATVPADGVLKWFSLGCLIDVESGNYRFNWFCSILRREFLFLGIVLEHKHTVNDLVNARGVY